MKSIQLTGIREMEVCEVADPVIAGDMDVLLKLDTVGVCGSDVHYYATGQIGSQVVQYPYPVGHECAAIVLETGAGVTRVKSGDRVAVEPAISCWECDQCRAGRHHTCRNLRFLGCPGQAPGCLSEFIVMPQECCFPIRDTMTMDEAAISEPLAIGVYAVQQSVSMQGARVGILGFGPIGMSVQLPALANGAEKAYVTDKLAGRLQLAAQTGACWTGNPDKTDIVAEIAEQEPDLLDVVFECCGQQEAVDQAIQLLKPGGKLMMIGIPPTLENWSIPVDACRRKEICIQNVRRQCDCVQTALDMIDDGRVDVGPMVTHRFGFDETQAAFDLVENYRDGVMKAMIKM